MWVTVHHVHGVSTRQETTRDGALKLLELVARRGDAAYDSFRRALLGSHDHLVQLLDDTKLSDGGTDHSPSGV